MSGRRGYSGGGAFGSAELLARHIEDMAERLRGALSAADGQAGPEQAGEGLAGTELTGEDLAGLDLYGFTRPAGSEREGRDEAGRGWWVMAQGGRLDEDDFEARERARDELLARVREAGILVEENVWVWDLSGRAQLVLSTLPTLERARKLAQVLRKKGLAIVVRREMP